MKQENFRIKRKLNAFTTALISNFLNIVIILILKGILGLFGNNGQYNVFYGIVEFVIITLFWVGFNYYSFRDTSQEDNREYSLYLIVDMIPIAVLTIISIVVMYIGTGTQFSTTWNALTFAVAPTLFVYLPYGFLYHIFGSMIPIAAFFIICMVYIVGLQLAGYALGNKSRRETQARLRKRRAQEEKFMAEQKEMAIKANKRMQNNNTAASRMVRQAARKRSIRPDNKPKIDKRDPLNDVTSNPIIQTEAFSPITDEMIEEAMKKEKQTAAQKELEKRKAREQKERPAQNSRRTPTRTAPSGTRRKQPENQVNDKRQNGPAWVVPGETRKREDNKGSNHKDQGSV